MASVASVGLNFIRGARIKARVVELQADNDILVVFQGHFLRVKNHSKHFFKIDDVLNLQVVGTQPLEFKIFDRSSSLDRVV